MIHRLARLAGLLRQQKVTLEALLVQGLIKHGVAACLEVSAWAGKLLCLKHCHLCWLKLVLLRADGSSILRPSTGVGVIDNNLEV